jgi:DNA repair ATPase RecN
MTGITFDPSKIDPAETGKNVGLFLFGISAAALTFKTWFAKHYRPSTEVITENTVALTNLNDNIGNVQNSLSAVHSRLGGLEERTRYAAEVAVESNVKIDGVTDTLARYGARLDEHDEAIESLQSARPECTKKPRRKSTTRSV